MSSQKISSESLCHGDCAQKCRQSLWYGALDQQCVGPLKVPFTSGWDADFIVKQATKMWLRLRKTTAA